MALYTVSNDNYTWFVRVRATEESEAALKGAVKLGMRWFGRRPTTALYRYGRIYDIFGPLDKKSGSQHLIGHVSLQREPGT